MELKISELPKKWKLGNFLAFANWYKLHVKSPHDIEEDYYLISE